MDANGGLRQELETYGNVWVTSRRVRGAQVRVEGERGKGFVLDRDNVPISPIYGTHSRFLQVSHLVPSPFPFLC